MVILPSTNRFTASEPLLPAPLVWRVRASPPTVKVADAWPVTVPAVAEVNTTVH